MSDQKTIGDWSASKHEPGEWQNGSLFVRIIGDEVELCDSSGFFNRYWTIPLAVIDELRDANREPVTGHPGIFRDP